MPGDGLIAQGDLGDLALVQLLVELTVGELVPGRLADLKGVPEQDDHHEDDHPEQKRAQG